MSQQVRTGQTDWSIRLWCYDSAGAAVTGLLHNSAGMAVSVVVRSKGRILSTTALTLVARSGGVHTDHAWTEVSGGEYVVDLADSYLATAERTISLTVAATAITGTVIVETLEVGRASELDSDAKAMVTAFNEMRSGNVFTAPALANAPSGTGGDATAANQEEIIALITGSQVIQVASPNVSGNLVLTQGDTYDGATGSNPKATWTVTTDYTSGWSVTFTIRDVDDNVVYTTSGTVDSATSVSVAINAPTGLTMTGIPGQWQGKFDVQLTKSTSKKTIALGVCYINEDQTR